MRNNPIHTFIQFVTGQIPDLITLGDLRWLMVALYWLLSLGGIGVALTTWRCDPAQRTANHLAVFVLRFTAAGMWFLGTLWKLPLPVSAGFKFWMAQTVKYSSFQIHADFMRVLRDGLLLNRPITRLSGYRWVAKTYLLAS